MTTSPKLRIDPDTANRNAVPPGVYGSQCGDGALEEERAELLGAILETMGQRAPLSAVRREVCESLLGHLSAAVSQRPRRFQIH